MKNLIKVLMIAALTVGVAFAQANNPGYANTSGGGPENPNTGQNPLDNPPNIPLQQDPNPSSNQFCSLDQASGAISCVDRSTYNPNHVPGPWDNPDNTTSDPLGSFGALGSGSGPHFGYNNGAITVTTPKDWGNGRTMLVTTTGIVATVPNKDLLISDTRSMIVGASLTMQNAAFNVLNRAIGGLGKYAFNGLTYLSNGPLFFSPPSITTSPTVLRLTANFDLNSSTWTPQPTTSASTIFQGSFSPAPPAQRRPVAYQEPLWPYKAPPSTKFGQPIRWGH